MKIKLGYYPILDIALALRQLYSKERFMPFVQSLESIYDRMSDIEKDFIDSFGEHSGGWLKVIEKLIDTTLNDTVSPEEFILSIYKHPELLIDVNSYSEDIYGIGENISKLWQNYFSNEIAKNNKILYEKTIEISRDIDTYDIIPYFLKISDRIEKISEETLKFLIKPEHQVNINDIDNVIVMPSIFASRNLTFWHNDNDYLFYISVNSSNHHPTEPSDMLLLKTMALNDRTRLKMLKILSTGNYSTGNMAEMLNVNSSTISRHFKLFKDAGYVDIFSQEGNSIYYSLNENELKSSFNMIFDYILNKGGYQND